MGLKRLLSLLRHGEWLRHVPVAVRGRDPSPVRMELVGLGPEPIDVSDDHVPVSMRPLVLGVRLPQATPARGCTLVMRDVASGARLGEIELSPHGEVPLTGATLSLFRTTSCRNAMTPAFVRWRRYALAWIHAQRAASRGDGLRMSAADLRCLNVYYAWPRPVYLIGVASGARSNLFPMDLVGRVGTGDFLLALRATSPAIELMETSRVIAMSAAPADRVAEVYALGAHHRRPSVDTTALSFSVRASSVHGLAVLEGGFTRELTVRGVHHIGSHVLFVCRVDAEQGSTQAQLGHVSQMYAEWSAGQKRPFEPAG